MKIKNSFTLLEVMIALLALASSAYLISGLQSKSIMKLIESCSEIRRVSIIKKYIYQLYMNPEKFKKTFKISIDNPGVNITAGKMPIDAKKSSLKQFSDELEIIVATGDWKIAGIIPKELKMISFINKTSKKKND